MKFLIFLFLITFDLSAQNSTFKDAAEMSRLSEKVVILFSANKINEAFQEMTPFWPIDQNEIASMKEKTIGYMKIVNDRYGKSIGSEKIKEQTIGTIALRQTYLIRYKISPLRLIFTYYKSSDGWILNAFKWDDNFTEEFRD